MDFSDGTQNRLFKPTDAQFILSIPEHLSVNKENSASYLDSGSIPFCLIKKEKANAL